MTIRLSEDAKRGWTRIAVSNGVSVTALLEAIGLRIDQRLNTPIPEEVFELARLIDSERRKR